MRNTAGRLRQFGTIAANVVPLVGLGWLGWDVWSLVGMYWVEAFATVVGATAKAVFAQRGSRETAELGLVFELRDKRGGWQPHPAVPPIYPRNIPFATKLLGLWVGVAVPISGIYWTLVGQPTIVSVEFTIGVVGLLASRLAGFYTDYLAREAYTDVSARAILATPMGVVCAVMLVGLVGTGLGAVGGIVVVTGVTGVRTLTAVRDVSNDRLGTAIDRVVDRLTADRDWERPPPEPDLPDAPVEARVTVSPIPVLLGSLPQIPLGFMNRAGVLVVCAFGLSVVLGDPVVIGFTATLVMAVGAVRIGSYYLRYGTVEYQRRGDKLVAYDTVLDAPQWVTPVETTISATTHNAVTDRLFSTGTLRIPGVRSGPSDEMRSDPPSDEMQLGPVDDLDAATDRLGLPIHPDGRPERDPAVVLTAAVLAGTFAVVPVGAALSSATNTAETVAIAIVAGPYVGAMIGGLVWAALSRI